MASKDQLIKWAIDHSGTLGLTATHFQWTKSLLPSYIDLSVRIIVGGKHFLGRGTANTEELSFTKAVAEAVERAVMDHTNLRSSNGIAAHVDENKAELSARLELIERDWFLSHFLTKTHFVPFEAQETLNTDLRAAISKLEQHGFQFLFVRNEAGCDYNTTSCFAFNHSEDHDTDNAFFIGLGCQVNLADSLESATIECIRDVAAYFNTLTHLSLTIDEFSTARSWTPEDHRSLTTNPQYVKDLKKVLFSPQKTNSIPDINKCIPLSEIGVERLEISLPELAGVPLAIYRAFSNQIQDLYFGPVLPSSLNFDRLSKVAGRKIDWNDIQRLPHPLS